jgi:peptide/nickel transport system ATP-binding protein
VSEAAALEVEGLEVTLPTRGGALRAVRAIDLEVARGETLCLVGESGSGKSMTALALMDLLPRSATRRVARFSLGGRDLRDAGEARMQALRGDRMAMIFQEPGTALNPAYRLGEQLVEGLLQHRPETSRGEAIERAVKLLDTCGIGEPRLRLRQYPHQLSGGLRQRMMIAMALMTEPELLIADEPTTALDATVKTQILALLARLQQEFRLAIILITHDLSVVASFGQRLAVMYAGEVVETGRAPEVLRQPLHPYTRALLACIPSPGDVAARGARLAYLPGQVPNLVGGLVGCQFRDRCALASGACSGEIPKRALGRGRFYRCLLPPAAIEEASTRLAAVPCGAGRAEADTKASAILLRDVSVNFAAAPSLLGRKREIRALDGVNLELSRGASLGIVGESGGGKSTLARVMLGLEKSTTGEVRLLGKEVAAYDRVALARIVQPVFQDPYGSLNPRRRVAATIRQPLDIHALGTPSERQTEVRRMMDLCGLPARLADAFPTQLSGGQRQRVAIATALILKPAILICDEPTSALDLSVQSQILNLIADLRDELGLTLVIISHDLAVIRFLADRVAVLYLGRIVESGEAVPTLNNPLHPYSLTLLAASGFAAAQPEHSGDPRPPLGTQEGCAFRPHCPHAMDVCAHVVPPLRGIAGRLTACHLKNPGTA